MNNTTRRRPTRAAAAGLAALLATLGFASIAPANAAPPRPALTLKKGANTVTLTVDGQKRTALIVVPTNTEAAGAPVVFGFHGHGGSGAGYAGKTPVATAWPNAVGVFPDGLPGHKGITDTEGTKSGWQTKKGELGDRDLRLFDELLKALDASMRVDHNRIYAVGHSNGAAFTGLLWQQRGTTLAAIATMGGQPGVKARTAPPRSVYMQMGRQDPIVPFTQQVLSVNVVKKRLGIPLNDQGRSIAADTTSFVAPRTSPTPGLELIVQISDTAHTPPATAATQAIAFFQRHHL